MDPGYTARKCVACKNCSPMFPKPVERSVRTPRTVTPAERHTCETHDHTAEKRESGVPAVVFHESSEETKSSTTQSTNEPSSSAESLPALTVSRPSSGLWEPRIPTPVEEVDWIRTPSPAGKTAAAEPKRTSILGLEKSTPFIDDFSGAVECLEKLSVSPPSSGVWVAPSPSSMEETDCLQTTSPVRSRSRAASETGSTSAGNRNDESKVWTSYTSTSVGTQTDEPAVKPFYNDTGTQTDARPTSILKVHFQPTDEPEPSPVEPVEPVDEKNYTFAFKRSPTPGPKTRPAAKSEQPAKPHQPVKTQQSAAPQQTAKKEWHTLWSVDMKKEW